MKIKLVGENEVKKLLKYSKQKVKSQTLASGPTAISSNWKINSDVHVMNEMSYI